MYDFTERVHTWPWGTSSFLSLSIIGIGWIPVFFISSPWRKTKREIRIIPFSTACGSKTPELKVTQHTSLRQSQKTA